MTTITEYVEQQGITADATFIGETEHTSSNGYGHTFRYWQRDYLVTLRRGDETTPEFEWHQGQGVAEDPDERPDSILDCLMGDAVTYENARDFEDWASDLGYDEDSRKAYAIYEEIAKQRDWLRDFLGDDFDYVAYELERL